MNRQYMKGKNIVHDLECIRISWIIYSHRAEQKGDGFSAGTQWCGGGFGDNKLSASSRF